MQFARLLSDTAAIKNYWIAGADRKWKYIIPQFSKDSKYFRGSSAFKMISGGFVL